MHVTMVREAWTDERLDKLENRVDDGFREVRGELREVRGEIGLVREELGELRADIKSFEKRMGTKFEAIDAKFDSKFESMNRTLQIGFGLIGAVLTGILGMFATQL